MNKARQLDNEMLTSGNPQMPSRMREEKPILVYLRKTNIGQYQSKWHHDHGAMILNNDWCQKLIITSNKIEF